MAFLAGSYEKIQKELIHYNATLVAVTKTKSNSDILEAYNAGHRDFAENYVQELLDKYESLPKDIRWHFIGHLQTNKVKYIASFIHLIHSVDTEKLLLEINKQGKKINRIIPCLLQVFISAEETKFGLDESELKMILQRQSTKEIDLTFVSIHGLMGMASFTENNNLITEEFTRLKNIFDDLKIKSKSAADITTLSMGMSSDYRIALLTGSNMVRIGSLLFGSRIQAT